MLTADLYVSALSLAKVRPLTSGAYVHKEMWAPILSAAHPFFSSKTLF